MKLILGLALTLAFHASADDSIKTRLVCDIDGSSGGQCQDCSRITIKGDAENDSFSINWIDSNGSVTPIRVGKIKMSSGRLKFSSETRKRLKVRLKTYKTPHGVGISATYEDLNTERLSITCAGTFQGKDVEGQQ